MFMFHFRVETRSKVLSKLRYDILRLQTKNILRRQWLVEVLLRFDRRRVVSGVARFRKLVTVLLIAGER